MRRLTNIDRGDEDTAHERHDEAYLGSSLHPELGDDGKGEHEDGNVREDVDRGGGEEEGDVVVTLAVEVGSPGGGDGPTLLRDVSTGSSVAWSQSGLLTKMLRKTSTMPATSTMARTT